MSFYFFYQRAGKESAWELALSTEREQIIREVQPAFSTALDLSGVPADNDWSKVKYQGPLYFDFDADGDLERVCEQFRAFLGKLHAEHNLDLESINLYASGGKGFHVEVPAECFVAKPLAQGYQWLPYVYREMAQRVYVDTLDLNVYTGKRGRQWRTTNVKRENGNYKVPLTLEEALEITPETYLELVSSPREPFAPVPPVLNASLGMLFEQARTAVVHHMRHRKKRQEKANAILDPWKQARRHPPTIERIMRGEDLSDTAGFQAIAMQLAIYATSVGMSEDELIRRTEKLCENHVSDGTRYGSKHRREQELRRMWQYMDENNLYDFEVGPIVRLLKRGTSAPDLGEVAEAAPPPPPPERPARAEGEAAEEGAEGGEAPARDEIVFDVHSSLRRGVFLSADGIFSKNGDETRSLCRTTFTDVVAFHDLDSKDLEFGGFEVSMRGGGHNGKRLLLPTEVFLSGQRMKQLLATQMVPYQGGDPETTAIMDALIARVGRVDQRIYTYPREGLSLITHPVTGEKLFVYLTQEDFRCPVPEDHPNYIRLRYRPAMAASAFRIDVHKAPELDVDEHRQAINDLLGFNRPEVVADMVGWFTAAHYRSAYLNVMRQFPLLQVYGEAGSGKTQTVQLLAHLHWYDSDRISVKSALACTPFVLEVHASSSASAPLIIDEWKPRELKAAGPKFFKLKDILKNSYSGAEIGEKGTVNRGSENTLSVIKMQASAPIVFMGEALEAETAIIERSVLVPMSQAYQTRVRTACFNRLVSNPEALSAVGRMLVEQAAFIDVKAMRREVLEIQTALAETVPRDSRDQPRLAARTVYNRAVVVHGLRIFKRTIQKVFGDAFDEQLDDLIALRSNFDDVDVDSNARGGALSEITKVVSRLANMSRAVDRPYALQRNRDYLVSESEGWVELRVERAYDNYRMACRELAETPLFDSIEAFISALRVYSPVIDRVCADSRLRGDDPDELIVRMSVSRLREAGAAAFRP